MENRNLWAPWRSQYVGGEREKGCVFCLARENALDPARLVVGVGERAIILLNRFPYSTGHLMVAPCEHIGEMEKLGPREVAEMWRLTVEAKRALTALFRPDGFNVGFNIGQAAGAGITDHLHLHVVPRWIGDTNFMPVLSDVRVMPHHLESVAEALGAEIKV